MFRTDTVTDLSYGLTFIVITAYFYLTNTVTVPNSIVSFLVWIWGIRLISYLFARILKTKRDIRFDGIRENFFKFAKFWLFQGISVWIILLPVVYFLNSLSPFSHFLYLVGSSISLIGLII